MDGKFSMVGTRKHKHPPTHSPTHTHTHTNTHTHNIVHYDTKTRYHNSKPAELFFFLHPHQHQHTHEPFVYMYEYYWRRHPFIRRSIRLGCLRGDDGDGLHIELGEEGGTERRSRHIRGVQQEEKEEQKRERVASLYFFFY